MTRSRGRPVGNPRRVIPVGAAATGEAHAAALAAELLGRIVERTPLPFVNGRANSGAVIEAVRLTDGTRLVVKHLSRDTDVIMRLTRDRGRAATLWVTGVLDRLPSVIDHATVAAAAEDAGWVIVMRDVSDALLSQDRILTREESRRIFTAIASMHATFRGQQIDGLCAMVDWLAFMSPITMAPLRSSSDELASWVLRSWEIFFAVAPHDVADAIAAIHARPEFLALALNQATATLVHGDLAPGNLGFTSDRVVILDWGLATQAPAALDYATLIANFRWRLATPPDLLLDDVRVACGDQHDERALQLAILATFANYGWLNAYRAIEQPDESNRPRELLWLDWWIHRARHVLATTWSPL